MFAVDHRRDVVGGEGRAFGELPERRRMGDESATIKVVLLKSTLAVQN